MSTAPTLQRAQDKFSSLHVLCMYVDFDGIRYGTLMEIFIFEPFDGDIHIKSLEAYPLKYFVGPGSSNLVQRVQLNLDQLDYIEQQDEWNKLALPRGHREIVQAMVETHSVDSKKNDQDAKTDRFVEMDLEMAASFCSMKTNVKRNGLVSVFLRILEYYSGILFLTTNRVGAIDDAFRSRLHLTLYYPKLTETQTLKIWKTNFQRLKENNKISMEPYRPPIDFNDKKIIAWVKKHWQDIQWNGRQIRNAFQAAVALAEFEAKQRDAQRDDGSSRTSPVLTTDHFKKLARASAQFSEYLRETHGEDEDGRAVLEKTRAMPTRRRTRTSLFSNDEDESDVMSHSGSCSESSGESGSGGDFDSGTESSDAEKKSKKKAKNTEGGRSHSRKDKKGKRRKEK
ncbi:hypothetical protein SLS63_009639 [Diaporthe eres]|uniref:ATPase AAA-type core domain-containing protein n=1 Tax=Diaporthe eres TaxID=83184 RepID=A0ABR1NZ74_DIAER